MDMPAAALDTEVVHHFPIGAEQHGTHARAAGLKVLHGERGDQSAKRFQEELLAEGAAVLIQAIAPVLEEELPRTAIGERVPCIGETEVRLAVALALEGEHGVRPALDTSICHAREVHAQEREA